MRIPTLASNYARVIADTVIAEGETIWVHGAIFTPTSGSGSYSLKFADNSGAYFTAITGSGISLGHFAPFLADKGLLVSCTNPCTIFYSRGGPGTPKYRTVTGTVTGTNPVTFENGESIAVTKISLTLNGGTQASVQFFEGDGTTVIMVPKINLIANVLNFEFDIPFLARNGFVGKASGTNINYTVFYTSGSM